ncbi:MAG TPA: Rieske 2Fe-2S domain-containing protein [Herpetosiphonaceae bacterium]|nr:Rieske 2Fe-2S domain-containing protein [Herpetosiphonaceae bacterium]
MRERTVVGRVEDVRPGQMIYVDIEGLPVALANVGGTVYAFADSCRHEGGPLSSGVLRDDVVTCPWHGWAYNVRSGKSVVPPVGLRLATYPVLIEDGQIVVEIDWPEE